MNVDVERLIREAVEAERQACARECEIARDRCEDIEWRYMARACADRIRARGDRPAGERQP